jgi:hypothetical protein
MRSTIIALCAAALIAATPAVFAQSDSSKTPGQEMYDKGLGKGSPGASGHTPGHEMQQKGSVKGAKGVSGYAPGQTTGSNTSGRDQTRPRK